MEAVVQKRLGYYRANQLSPKGSTHGGHLGLQSKVEMMCGDEVVSVLFDWDCYVAGAVHSDEELASLVFDVLAAERVELASLFRPEVDYLRILSQIAIRDLRRQKERPNIPVEGENQKWIERGAGGGKELSGVYADG